MPHSKSNKSSPKFPIKHAVLFVLAAAIGYASLATLLHPNSPEQIVEASSSHHSPTSAPTPLPHATAPATAKHKSHSATLAALQTLAPEHLAAAQSKLLPTYLALMVEALSNSDPVAAARLIDSRSTPPPSELAQTLAQKWSQSDPQAALAWFAQQPPDPATNDYRSDLQEILLSCASRDPALTYSYLCKLSTSPEQRNELLTPIASAWASSNLDQAVDWLDSLDPATFSPAAFQEAQLTILTASLEKNPRSAALALAKIQSTSLQRQLAPQAAASWANVDLAAAVDWLDTLTETEIKGASLAAIATQSLDRDPEAALTVLLSFPELFETSATSLNTALNNLAQKKPTLLLRHFDEIPPSAKAATAAQITTAALTDDHPLSNYSDWFAALPDGEPRDAAARIAIRHYAAEKPEEAAKWAQNLSLKAERLETLSALIGKTSLYDLPKLAGSIASLELAGEEGFALEKALQNRLSESLPYLPLPQ